MLSELRIKQFARVREVNLIDIVIADIEQVQNVKKSFTFR